MNREELNQQDVYSLMNSIFEHQMSHVKFPTKSIFVKNKKFLQDIDNKYKLKYPLTDECIQLYTQYNNLIFDDKIINCYITWDPQLKKCGGTCKYIKFKDNPYCVISISPDICDTIQKVKSVLLHEMIHAYLMLVDKDLKSNHEEPFLKWIPIIKNKTGIQVTVMCYYNNPNKKRTYECFCCKYKKNVIEKNNQLLKKCNKCPVGRFIWIK